jgi:enoyl-CoA hydratase/carnithine racemase
MTDSASPVDFRLDGPVGIVTLQFAPHNLVGKELGAALIDVLAKAPKAGARAIVLRSSLRHFSAGADLGLFHDQGARLNPELNPPAVLKAFADCPVPIVAGVHGVALGGGFELALACDIIVAASSAKFGLVEATLGLHPLMGGIQRIADRVGEARAKEIVMLGRRHDAATLERWNVINRVVPDAQLEQATLTLAQELAAGPTVAHAATKKLMNIFLAEGMEAADAAMKDVQRAIFTSQDLVRGLESFRAKGPGSAVFQGD